MSVFNGGVRRRPRVGVLAIGMAFDYCVETEKGHYITYDECYRYPYKGREKNGLFIRYNIDGEDKIFAEIRNCNVNKLLLCTLRTSQLLNKFQLISLCFCGSR